MSGVNRHGAPCLAVVIHWPRWAAAEAWRHYPVGQRKPSSAVSAASACSAPGVPVRSSSTNGYPMKSSNNGLALVKAFEGCLKPASMGMFKPYYCPANVLTIGYGHTNNHGRSFNSGSLWSQAECDAELASDMEHFEAAFER